MTFPSCDPNHSLCVNHLTQYASSLAKLRKIFGTFAESRSDIFIPSHHLAGGASHEPALAPGSSAHQIKTRQGIGDKSQKAHPERPAGAGHGIDQTAEFLPPKSLS